MQQQYAPLYTIKPHLVIYNKSPKEQCPIHYSSQWFQVALSGQPLEVRIYGQPKACQLLPAAPGSAPTDHC